jgi:hypothetical protein
MSVFLAFRRGRHSFFRLSGNGEIQNTRPCGGTLFAKEGRGLDTGVLALFSKEGGPQAGCFERLPFASRPKVYIIPDQITLYSRLLQSPFHWPFTHG